MPEDKIPIIQAVCCKECNKLIPEDGRYLVVVNFHAYIHVSKAFVDKAPVPRTSFTTPTVFCDKDCFARSIGHLH